LLGAGQVSTTTLTYDNLDGYISKSQTPLPFDESVKKAQILLAKAGYENGCGISAIELSYNSTSSNGLIAEAVQQMWRKNLGIKVNLQQKETTVHIADQASGDYEIARYGWTVDFPSNLSSFQILTSANPNNQTGWKNAEYDRLYQVACEAKTVYERNAAFDKLDAIEQAEVPILLIYDMSQMRAIDARIYGFYQNATDSHPLKFVGFCPGSRPE